MESLYMFALVPPPALADRIHNERLAFAERYGAKRALRPPVHITLYEPFKVEADKAEELLKIGQWVGQQAPFMVELRNFGYFNKSVQPVVFIDVVKTSALSALKRGFIARLRHYLNVGKPMPFNPHITIGYRDVAPALMPAIMARYSVRRFQGEFLADAIFMWRHDGEQWQVFQKLELRGRVVAPQLFSCFLIMLIFPFLLM